MEPELTPESFAVTSLGPASVPSPLALSNTKGQQICDFVPDDVRIHYEIETSPGRRPRLDLLVEKAGPRAKIFSSRGSARRPSSPAAGSVRG